MLPPAGRAQTVLRLKAEPRCCSHLCLHDANCNEARLLYLIVAGFRVLMITDGSDLQTPEQSPACLFYPQKKDAEHFQRSRGHPKRGEGEKNPATLKPVYGCHGNPCPCLLTSRLRAALVPSPTFPSSCLLMFCKMLSSRESSTTCRSALLT